MSRVTSIRCIWIVTNIFILPFTILRCIFCIPLFIHYIAAKLFFSTLKLMPDKGNKCKFRYRTANLGEMDAGIDFNELDLEDDLVYQNRISKIVYNSFKNSDKNAVKNLTQELLIVGYGQNSMKLHVMLEETKKYKDSTSEDTITDIVHTMFMYGHCWIACAIMETIGPRSVYIIKVRKSNIYEKIL